MQYITSGNRIATENFVLGDLYTITFTSGVYINSACIGIGDNFVSFMRNEPELLFTLNMETAELVSSIDLYAGGTGTTNYNELTNKPQIGGVELVGNKSLAAFGIQPEITEESPLSSALVSGLGSAAAAETSDFATAAQGALAASAVQPATMDAALALKQDALSSAQLEAVNSGMTSADVAQITSNKNNILLIPRCDMDRLPITFTTNSAGNLKGYTIYGNADKVGEQTVNLFDKSNADNRLIYPDENTGEVKVPASSWTYSLTIPVEPNTTYTISKVISTRRRLAGYSAYPNVGDTAEFVENSYTTDSGREIVTFTTTANTHYVIFFYLNAANTEPTPERITELINSIQLELGSAMTDYEPYGYKIPITCGGATTNVYCDAQLDKGDMLTLGESEINIPVLSGSNTITTTLTNKPIMWIKYE